MKKLTLVAAITESESFLKAARELHMDLLTYQRAHPETWRYQHIDLDLAAKVNMTRNSARNLARVLKTLVGER